MQSTRKLPNGETELAALLARYPEVSSMVKRIIAASGVPYLVGGAVRDLVLGRDVHDIDIEVHNLPLSVLSDFLAQEGPVSYVGKSFGVLKLHGSSVDWSLPRSDTVGRKPQVSIDPKMGIYEALRRRDLTMNAMAINLATGEWVDPFKGIQAIADKTLSSPDISFFEDDPLRFYRVMQFIGRFEMEPDKTLHKTCSQMTISTISVERIEYEFEKLLLKSARPSLGIRWFDRLGRLPEILPELVRAKDTLQEPEWHPEGSVFEHSMQALDAAAAIEKNTSYENLVLRYAALCHDLGKVTTSINKDGRIRSPGHAQVGVTFAASLLKKITRKKKLIETVKLLVNYHMEPPQFVSQAAKEGAYKRLAVKLAPLTNLEMLADLSLADRRGRNPDGHEPLTVTPDFILTFLTRAAQADALTQSEKPLLQGRDIEHLVEPGPEMGRLLDKAFTLQIDQGISNKKELLKIVERELKIGPS